ncbi:MAG: ABC transporter ATP-binding protein [Elusimicrobia bacterium]|nr:ABC transporter ATP-binding protein [Elusimicrobiota bacterium]
MEIIRVENMTKRYPIAGTEFTALSNINLTFEKGDFCGVIGPSGSGKTTLLNIIGSLDVPSTGSTLVLGNQIEKLSEKAAANLRSAHMGFIFQTYNLLPVYTVYENVEFPLLLIKMSSEERKEKILDAIEWVHLTDKINSRPSQLSGGECQRVAIARAIVKKPELILADEPTANLDANNSFNILAMMVKLNEELKSTFIFATHDEKVIKYLKRKIFLMDGRVVKDERVG